jgi:spore germination cell wall hydrolase CwlJ-like protein
LHRRQVRKWKGRATPLALAVVVLLMPPSRMGSREIAVLTTGPAPGGSFHFLASPFGTIHTATFRFSQPVGTVIPASSGLHHGDGPHPSPITDGRENVEVNRSLKGPRLLPQGQDVKTAMPASREVENPPSSRPPSSNTGARANDEAPAPGDADLTDSGARETVEPRTAAPWPGDGAVVRAALIYFATTSLGRPPAAVSPWPLEAAPSPPLLAEEDSEEALAKLPDEAEAMAQVPAAAAPSGPNETIAPKGEVTGEGRRPKSPAELLGLAGDNRAKHEKCLASAIYFEARGEPVRGQMAVAQVVINRVFSGYYPDNVCGVVYQNTRRHRHLRCQFSFTCDGIPDRVTEPDAWDRATRIAHDALDGNFWLNDIGKATHYHARWVHPWWVREMRRLDRIGVHTFYRPRKWGDGAGSPVWGDATARL